MRVSLAALVFAVLSVASSSADAANYVLYFHGRGQGSWNGEVANAAGWTNVTFSYNGNAKLNGNETNVTVTNAISTYCSGGNACIIHCYSAGCLRTLKAVSDLRAGGNSLPGLYWAEASGSAAGGTKLAELSTSGWTKYIAKLLGQQEKVDFDLTPGAARGTWGYVQDDMGVTMFHIAGAKNVCKKILFVKICGNKYVDAGVGDGVVGMDSASGASAQGKVWDGCAVAKYPYRTYDSWYSPCGGDGSRDHFGLPGHGATIIAACLAGTSTDQWRNWNDNDADGLADCADSSGQCDNAFTNSSADFSKTPANVPVASDVSGTSSPTVGSTSGATCMGKCGGWSGTPGYYCDAICVSYGDCAPDYYAANCHVLNSM